MNIKFYKRIALLFLTAIIMLSACNKLDELKGDENLTEPIDPADSNYVSFKNAVTFASSSIKQTKEGRLTLNIKNAVKSKTIDKQKTILGKDGKNAYFSDLVINGKPVSYEDLKDFVLVKADK